MVTMATKEHWTVATLILIMLTEPSASSVSSYSSISGQVDNFIEHLMEAREVDILSLAIVKDGKTVVTKGYGLDNQLDNKKQSANNQIQAMHLIASLTKAFTAIVLGQLLQENSYTFDTPVREILPEIRFPEEYLTEHVTVRDLLAHRTGIPRYDWLWIADAMDFQEITRRIRYMATSEFRGRAVYNNNMYALAGHIAEKLGDTSWEQLITTRLLRPLGMNSTTFWKHGRHVQNFVQGQREVERDRKRDIDPGMEGLANIAPAIAMISCAKDMARWLHFLLKPSRHLEQIVAEVMRPSTIVKDNPNIWTNEFTRPEADEPHIYDKYGLGWFLGSYRSYQTAMHYGSYIGSYSHITLMREKGIAIFTSHTGGKQGSPYNINSIIHTYILDLLLGHSPWLTPDRASDFSYDSDLLDYEESAQEVPKYQNPSRPLEDYMGVYYNSVFGFSNITQGGSTLVLTYGIMQFEMHSQMDDVFEAVPIQKDWGSWPLSIPFNFETEYSPSFKIHFQGPIEFHKIPNSVNVNEWTTNYDLKLYRNKTPLICSLALTIHSLTYFYGFMASLLCINFMISNLNYLTLS